MTSTPAADPAIVFIHGIGLGSWLFEAHFKAWFAARGWQVYCVNLPGHVATATAAEKRAVTIDSCVEHVEQVLRTQVSPAEAPRPYVLVGMSMGGAVCQRLLAKGGLTNGGLRAVVLLSSVPPQHNLTFSLRLFQRLAVSMPAVLVDFFRGEVHPALMFSPESLQCMAETDVNRYRNQILTGFTQLEREIFFADLLPAAMPLPCPLKIIGGEKDALFPPDVTHFTAAFYGGTAEILPDLGHFIPVEYHYQQGIEAIVRFLAEVMNTQVISRY